MKERSPTLSVRLRGPLACFTRPEFKTERVSYPVITPSAARGAIEAILWKPAIVWRIERIRVLAPVQFVSFRRNEVNSVVPVDSVKSAMKGGSLRDFLADEDRAQRNTVALREVDYVIDAHFEMTERVGTDDNLKKFVEMFSRRVEKGQAFNQPYLGCREFAAEFLPATDAPNPIDETRDLGLMLHDIEFGRTNKPRWFAAQLTRGVVEVPPWNPAEAAA
jgi:CRISPR-associated protein Cas5d